jgi:hypothetical protein
MTIKKTLSFFDKLEDKNRSFLSRLPILYAFIGGTGVVLFWRGVWHMADIIFPLLYTNMGNVALFRLELMDSLTSLIIGVIILLGTGLFVTNFIGNRIIISGIKHEKKLEEKESEEIESEEYIMTSIYREIKTLRKDMEDLKHKR